MLAEIIVDVTSDFLQVRDKAWVCLYFCQSVKSIVGTHIRFQSTATTRHACLYHLSNKNTGCSFTIVQVTNQLHLKHQQKRSSQKNLYQMHWNRLLSQFKTEEWANYTDKTHWKPIAKKPARTSTTSQAIKLSFKVNSWILNHWQNAIIGWKQVTI